MFIVENQPVPLDRRVLYEALAVKELGYDVSIISPKARGEVASFSTIDGIHIYRHPMPVEADGKSGFLFEYANALFWELLLSIRIFLQKPFHVIHGANPPDHIFLIALLFKVLGVKYVFDHHDISPENYLAKFARKDVLYRITCFMEKLTFKVADIVISTNQSYKKIAMGRGGKKDREVFVVRNGPDLSNITIMPPNNDLKGSCDHLVAYIGVIGNQEGIDVLLRAARHIVYEKGRTDIKFIIIGTGPHWQTMVQLSGKMGLAKYVEFTGFIPFKKVYEILATADVCVNPEHNNSFTDKSTMVKIMDYMVFGKPIVQFDTTEGRVTAGESATYVDNNDEISFAEAILSLLNDPDQRTKMGEIGRKRIDQSLNWDKQKGNLRKAYGCLVEP